MRKRVSSGGEAQNTEGAPGNFLLFPDLKTLSKSRKKIVKRFLDSHGITRFAKP